MTQRGFTIVELLVVLALSAVLATAISRVVITQKQNTLAAAALGSLQESSRYALEYLSRDLRMAGYLGCAQSSLESGRITSLLDATDSDFNAEQHDFSARIAAWDDLIPGFAGRPSRIGGVKPKAGADVFISSAALESDIRLVSTHASTAANLLATGPMQQLSLLHEGLVVMLTDCNTAHIFALSNQPQPNNARATLVHNRAVSHGPDNTRIGLGVNYPPGSVLLFMNQTYWFIGESQVLPGTTSLYRYQPVQSNEAEEMVPYVDDMQLLFSVDTNNDGAPDVYRTPAQVEGLDGSLARDAHAVNITLTVTSPGRVDMPGVTDPDGDGVLRREYSRLVNIRNAGIDLD